MKRIALVATLVILSAEPALAHAGHGIQSGFTHPFLGWDHLLAMLAVGAWGATLGNRAIWAVPAAFVGMMIVGGILAGFVLYVVTVLVKAFGGAGIVSPLLAAWFPVGLAFLFGVSFLLNKEDG